MIDDASGTRRTASFPAPPASLIPASIVIAVLLALPTGAAGADGIPWARDLDGALSKAKQSGKLVMVDFFADWCGWCRRLDQDTYSDPSVTAHARASLVSVKVNGDKNRKITQRYGVRGYPTILFIDGDGAVWGRIGGYTKPKDFLVRARKFDSEFRRLKAKLAEAPKDPQVHIDIGRLHLESGDGQSARLRFEAASAADPGARTLKGAELDYLFGEAYLSEGKYKEAVASLERALKSESTLEKSMKEKVFTQLAAALVYAEEFAKAVATLDLYLQKVGKPSNRDWVLFVKGFAYYETSRKSRGEESKTHRENARKVWQLCRSEYPNTVWGKRAASALQSIPSK